MRGRLVETPRIARHLTAEVGSAQSRRGAVSRPRRLDAVDARIIEALQRNGRELVPTHRRRSRRVRGDGPSAVRAPRRRRHPPGHRRHEPARARVRRQAMVGVRTSGPPEPVADEIARWDEAGLRRRHGGAVRRARRARLRGPAAPARADEPHPRLDGVLSTESFLYLELCKQVYDWGAGSFAGGDGDD